MFLGDSEHTIDDKGRVFVPKRFLDALSLTPEGARLAYLARGQDDCLYLFPEAAFQRALAELNTSTFNGEELRAARRVFFANTARVELDSSGRILIPEKLRAGANLGREVVMIGVGDRAEIWQKEAWSSYESANLPKLDTIDRAIARESSRTDGGGGAR